MLRPALFGVAAASLLLGGCVSLFPETDPVQLYRFDGPAAQSADINPTVSVLRGPTGFTRSAAGDRILTTNGAEAAFIKGARWTAPASVLFDEALTQAFDASGAVRLATRGEVAGVDAVLRIEVTVFEARYTQGMEAPPTAVVELRATITSGADRSQSLTRRIRTEQLAAENRVSSIVAAVDQAVDQAMQELVVWTSSAPVVKAPPTASPR